MATFDEELSAPKVMPGPLLLAEHVCTECGKIIHIKYKHGGPSFALVETEQNPFRHCPRDATTTVIPGYIQEIFAE